MIRVDLWIPCDHYCMDRRTTFKSVEFQSIQITLANFLNANCKNLEFFLLYVQILEPKLNLNL